MKSLIKKCSIRALGYDRFLFGVYCLRRVQHSIFPQWSEFVTLAALIDPDTLILDIGANIGYVTAVLATVPGAHVYAFEPDAENFACLVRTVGQRSNVTVQKIAIGADDGEAVLRAVFEDGIKQHALSRVCTASEPLAADQRVSVRSVDSLRASMTGQIGLIKLDVEGSECEVLRGMLTSVGSSRPYIHAEVCGEVAIGEYNRFCATSGYRAYKWKSRQFHRAEEIVGGGNFLLAPREREGRLHLAAIS
jgi:FkbM family methyltransferase